MTNTSASNNKTFNRVAAGYALAVRDCRLQVNSGAMKANPMSGTLMTTLQAKAEPGVMPFDASGPAD